MSVTTIPHIPDTVLVICCVKHSQRVLAPSLKPRVSAKRKALVCGHYTSMTGLREACSHIAALLFTVERNTQHQNMTTCTSLPCSWLPSSYHSVNYSEIADIDFATPQLNRTRGQSYDFCFNSSLNQCSNNASI